VETKFRLSLFHRAQVNLLQLSSDNTHWARQSAAHNEVESSHLGCRPAGPNTCQVSSSRCHRRNAPPADHQGHMDVQIHKDVEGTDGRERGEDQDQDFEQKSALFSLTSSEILIVNHIMWEHQVSDYYGSEESIWLRDSSSVFTKEQTWPSSKPYSKSTLPPLESERVESAFLAAGQRQPQKC